MHSISISTVHYKTDLVHIFNYNCVLICTVIILLCAHYFLFVFSNTIYLLQIVDFPFYIFVRLTMSNSKGKCVQKEIVITPFTFATRAAKGENSFNNIDEASSNWLV